MTKKRGRRKNTAKLNAPTSSFYTISGKLIPTENMSLPDFIKAGMIKGIK